MADTRGIRAGRAFVELGVSDKLSAGLRRAQKRLKAFGDGLRSVGTRLTAIGAGAVASLLSTVKVFTAMGDTLDKMSKRTGVSVESLSELGFAAEQSGADLATFEKGVRSMQRSINDLGRGLSTQTDAFATLGLTMADLDGLSPEAQFKLIAERLSQIEDPSRRAAIAMQIFGRAGSQLLPLMEGGAAGIEELQEQARRLGLTVSTQTAKDAAELNDTLNILWRVIKQGVFVIGSALAPVLQDLAERITRVIVGASDWIRQNRAVVVSALKVAAAVALAGVVLIGLGVLVAGVAATFGLLASIITGVGTALGIVGAALGALLSPIGLVVAAVVGLGGTLLVTSGKGGEALAWLMEQFTRLRDWVSKVTRGISDALAAGDIALAAEILWLSLKVIWQKGVAALNSAWLEARRFFVSTAQSMWYGALAAAQIVLHALEVGWIETTAFLSKTWSRFTGGFQKAWESASSFVAKRMLEIQGLFDDGLDVEAAKKAVDEQLEQRLGEIDDRTRAALADREARRSSERDRSSDLNDATLSEIGKQYEDAQKALDAQTDERVTDAQRELEAARKRLDDAIEEARRRREEAEAEPDSRPRNLLAEFEDRLRGIGDLVAEGISVRGTFNASAVQGLASDDAVAERTAKATEQTAKHTRQLADAAKSGGLTFA
ncbi:MAG: hypothetical protein AAFX79_03145 [Planctomycetota bacterium]|nr:hypothetical protein [bacterium]